MAVDIGKIFEKELEKVFRSLKESHLMGWHRLPDTSSAGGHIIGEQPSDYLLALPPGSCSLNDQRLLFMEAKASEKHTGLTKAAMQPAQRGAVSFYRNMLQLPYLVFFYAADAGVIQIWDGSVVVAEERISKYTPLCVIEGAGSGIKLNLDVVQRELIDFFELPAKSKTLANYCG